MRNTFADTFYRLGREDRRLVVVVADISPAGSIAKFREEFPDRFVNTGVAEQIMIGLAAGMALRGLRPFAYTIATFALYRPFEFVRDDIAYQGLPVTVVGIGGGVNYSTLGGTHHAMEDVAIASAIPGMTVIAPSDPLETTLATEWCVKRNQGPVYLRLGKAGEPKVTEGAVEPFEIGRLRYLKRGKDTCILAYGVVMKMAADLAKRLEVEKGESVSLASVHTLKPLDAERIADALKTHRRVAVIEEHVERGGLGQMVKAIAWEAHASCELQCFSLKDEFIHVHGSHGDILAAHGLEPGRIARKLGLS